MSAVEEEFAYRERTFRLVERREHVCRACAEVVATECFYVRRDNGEPWVDPFQAPGVAMFLSNHHLFCVNRPPWFVRMFRAFPGYDVREEFVDAA